MHLEIVSPLKETAAGAIAEDVIKACVHCGICNAACPTFRLTGDELDGPRGRIWLMKRALEGEPVGALTQYHLDRCLECRACESVCPSGVEYHRLLDVTRPLVDEKAPPRAHESQRSALRFVAARPGLLAGLMGLGRALRSLTPKALAGHLTASNAAGPWPKTRRSRRMLILGGCVQQAAARRFNAATARVLDHLGISLVEQSGCCGAVPAHLGAKAEAKAHARRQIEAWDKALASGFEAVVVNASGCAAFVRDWPDLFADEPAMAEKARRVITSLRDPIEIVRESGIGHGRAPAMARIAVHDPCTLRNGPGLGGEVERLLTRLGYDPQPVADPSQCCGSAGAYSLFQPELSGQLREQRLAALTAGAPEAIFTANIGCWMHMSATSPVPVRHWIEAVDDLIAQGALGVVPTPSPPAAPVRAEAKPVQASPRPKAKASAKPPAAPAKAEAKPVPAAPAAKVNAKAAAKTNAPPAPPPAAPVKSKASPVQASPPPKAKAAVKPPAAPAKAEVKPVQASPPPKAKASAKPPAAPAKAKAKPVPAAPAAKVNAKAAAKTNAPPAPPPAAPVKSKASPVQASPPPKAKAAVKPPAAPAKGKAKPVPTPAAGVSAKAPTKPPAAPAKGKASSAQSSPPPKATTAKDLSARPAPPAGGTKKGAARPK